MSFSRWLWLACIVFAAVLEFASRLREIPNFLYPVAGSAVLEERGRPDGCERKDRRTFSGYIDELTPV